MHNYKKHPKFKVTTLPEGKTSPFTACRECGRRFYHKNGTTRFNAILKHAVNGCRDEK